MTMTRITTKVAASALGLLLALMAPALPQFAAGATIAVAGDADVTPPFPTEPAPAPPVLENPVTGFMESGRLIVSLSATRRYADGPSVNYGFRTGQLIPITIVISADPDLIVDLGALKSETLHKDGSKFEMAAPPVVSEEKLNGKNITIVRLVVRTWAMDTAVPFNCQFHYATGYLPDHKTPDWKLATTPDFLITTSRTATESSSDLLDGDVSPKTTATAWWSKPLEYGGALVMALVPLWLAYRFWIIRRSASMASRAQKAWSIIDEMQRQRESAGHEEFSPTQLKLISAALREYLGTESIPTQLAHEPLERFFSTQENGAELKALALSALAKLDRAVYSQSHLTLEETNALVHEISRIIPRD